jgi:hypothetical protein
MAHALDVTQPKPRRSHTKFSPADDDRLRFLVESADHGDWHAISHKMDGKNARRCK